MFRGDERCAVIGVVVVAVHDDAIGALEVPYAAIVHPEGSGHMVKGDGFLQVFLGLDLLVDGILAVLGVSRAFCQ